MNSEVKNSPILIAGPCLAESYSLLEDVAGELKSLTAGLGWKFYFKASFDKANRSSAHSPRGPGLDTALKWFSEIKKKFSCEILTDVHEVDQVAPVAEVCSALQIPAFLCRQTDLLEAAIMSRRFVNIKKGQFMSPSGMLQIAEKARSFAKEVGVASDFALTERGSMFGYGDLVVDMRAFRQMAAQGDRVIFDVTHSTQRPIAQLGEKVSRGQREFSSLLARSAVATGYLSGLFCEVHPCPQKAQSDAATQLSVQQAKSLISQLIELWTAAQSWKNIDEEMSDQ